MALLPDSSKIHVIYEQVKPAAAAASGCDLWKEIIHIFPQVFLFGLLTWIAWYFRKPLYDLLKKVDGVEYKDLKLSFLSESFNGIIRMADKNSKWNVKVPEKDKERVLKRALELKKKLQGKRFLWVDDCPENNNNERRMFQELGIFCDFAQSTDKALEYVRDYDYDWIVSDMERVGDSKTAGIELILALQKANIDVPVILYVGTLDGRKAPDGAYDITNRPDKLLSLMLSLVERTRQ
jgi:CheY-like chemotaxis protein